MSLDEYRVAKRVEPGTPLRFEFRADNTGTFRFSACLNLISLAHASCTLSQ